MFILSLVELLLFLCCISINDLSSGYIKHSVGRSALHDCSSVINLEHTLLNQDFNQEHLFKEYFKVYSQDKWTIKYVMCGIKYLNIYG